MTRAGLTATTSTDGTVVGADGVAWRTFSSPGARVAFRIQGNTLENVVVGHMDGPVALLLMHEFDLLERAHGGSFVGYHSWWQAPTYTSEYRALWMTWLAEKARSGALLETHFLTSSRIVRMGLTVANVAYPKIRFGIHDNDAAYLAVRRRHMVDAVTPVL